MILFAFMQDAALVYFDGRLAEAALLLARGARAAGGTGKTGSRKLSIPSSLSLHAYSGVLAA